MKEIYSLPLDNALASVEIEKMKMQRDALQAKIDEVLAIAPRPIHEIDYEAGRSLRRGFNEFRTLAHDILARP